MKTLIIPDLHNKTGWVERCIEAEKPDETVFLGDYFDFFDDTPKDVMVTAQWLKRSIAQPKRIHLFGNHDISYAFKHNQSLWCPGFTELKCFAINKILTLKEWENLRLCYFTQGHLLSHAGANPRIFEHPVLGMTPEIVEEKCQQALKAAKGGYPSAYTAYGDRMGARSFGGIIWQDWDSEFRTASNLNQIVGHTPAREIRTRHSETSLNYCVDTVCRHITLIVDGVVSHADNKYR